MERRCGSASHHGWSPPQPMLGQEMSPVAKGGQAAASAYASPHEEGTAHAFSRLKKKRTYQIQEKQRYSLFWLGTQSFHQHYLGQSALFFCSDFMEHLQRAQRPLEEHGADLPHVKSMLPAPSAISSPSIFLIGGFCFHSPFLMYPSSNSFREEIF